MSDILGLKGRAADLKDREAPSHRPGRRRRALSTEDWPKRGPETPMTRHDVTQAEAEQAVRTLIQWAGDDPAREGLGETPAPDAKSYRELFAGYATDPRGYLERTF